MKVRIFSEKEEISYLSISFQESFKLFCSEILIDSTFETLDRELNINVNGAIYEVYIVSVYTKGEGRYEYRCIPRLFQQLKNSKFPAFVGLKPLEQVLKVYGIPYEFNQATEAVFWDIPECKYLTLISHIRDRAKTAQGGGILNTVTLRNTLKIVDLKSTIDLSEGMLSLLVPDEVQSNMDWTLNVPGTINLVQNSIRGKEIKKYIFEDGYGEATIYETLTVEEKKEESITIARNIFYKLFYTSNQIRTEPIDVGGLGLGEKVETPSSGNFMVYSVESFYTADAMETKLTLVTKPWY